MDFGLFMEFPVVDDASDQEGFSQGFRLVKVMRVKIRQRYCVNNWPEYNKALGDRGNVALSYLAKRAGSTTLVSNRAVRPCTNNSAAIWPKAGLVEIPDPP